MNLRGAEHLATSSRSILLRGIPKTCKASDIRRAVYASNVQGVSNIGMEYEGYKPTDMAIIQLTHTDHLRANLFALKSLHISGLPVTAEPFNGSFNPSTRGRGTRGRMEAADRGILTGDGHSAGINNSMHRNVTVWGLPGRSNAKDLLGRLSGYKFSRSDEDKPIVKIPLPPDQFTLYSRYLVRMRDTHEAHRLVRDLHLRFWDPEKFYQIRARVLY